MRQSPCRQYLWALSVVAISLTLMGCAVRQPPRAQVRPAAIDTRYTVDRIEEQTTILLPRGQRGKPMAVPHDLLTFAQEGDIICSTGDPAHPYVLDQDTTAIVQRDIEHLLAKLQERPDSIK